MKRKLFRELFVLMLVVGMISMMIIAASAASVSVIFTADSEAVPGKSMTIDYEQMAEAYEEVMTAYLEGGITIRWYLDGTDVSSRATGDFGEIFALTEADAFHKLYAVFYMDSKFIFSESFLVQGDAPIYVDGVGMESGDYLANGANTTQKTKPSGGYAHYLDNILTLKDFHCAYTGSGIRSRNSIHLVLAGNNILSASADGIRSYEGSVHISGTGSLTVDAGQDAINAVGDSTVTDVTITVNTCRDGLCIIGTTTLTNVNFAVLNDGYSPIFSEHDLVITNSALNLNGGDGLCSNGNVSVTDCEMIANVRNYGIFGRELTITGSAVTITAGGLGIYCDRTTIIGSKADLTGYEYGIGSGYGVTIIDSNVTARSTNTRNDSSYWAIGSNEEVFIDPELLVQASTEPDGTLEPYDPAKHHTYDYIQIKRNRPDTPTVKAANVASTGKIKLTWEKVDGAAKYEVYRATSKTGTYSLLKTTTGTSLTNTSTTAGKAYYYKVRSVDANGNKSEFSNIVSRTCDLPRPEITLSNIASSGKIKISWNAVEGATKYEVYRSTDNKTWSLLKSTTGTTLTNTSTTAGKLYYYKVRAIHEKSAANSAYSAVKNRRCDLPRPEITLSNIASSGKIKISWKAIEGATKYEVYRSTDNKTWTLLKSTTGTSLTNTSTTAGKLYYYKVKAIASNSAANSADSSVKSRRCDLARPTLTVKLNSSGKPVLTWAKIEGAVKYEIYRSTDNKTWSLLKSTTGTKLTNTSAKAGTTYYYKVRAIAFNSAANSAYCSVKSIKAG